MTKKKTLNFDGSCFDYHMRNGRFAIGLNMPPAIKGGGVHGLPPYAKRMSYLVDEYPACPDSWMRSEGRTKSFFVPVLEDAGMWLDLNENFDHTHHVAVVLSIQGVNPITGLPCKDVQMEQYIDECPKHKIPFGPDRYCKKCDYKWPKQNYICTTGTRWGHLWLDGFRSIDGMVRQYILTAEKMRGVASNIIGKDRVYAIGASFFLSKDKKPEPKDYSVLRGISGVTKTVTGGGIIYEQPHFFSPVHTPINWCGTSTDWNENTNASDSMLLKCSESLNRVSCSATGSEHGTYTRYEKDTRSKARIVSYRGAIPETKKLEIGAGANIRQTVSDDPERLDFWHSDPEAIICVNYCTEIDATKIIEYGKVNIEGHKEGFLKSVPVGN